MKGRIINGLIAVLLICFSISIGSPVAHADTKAKRGKTAKNENIYIVEKDGVEATLYDCRYTLGTNRAGMIKFNNTNDYPVTVKYQVYGITSQGKKTKVDEGELEFAAKQAPSWGYVYQYDDYMVNNKYQKYEEYAVAIKVSKSKGGKKQVTLSEGFASIKQKVDQGKTLSQSDYVNAIKIAEGYQKYITKYNPEDYINLSDEEFEEFYNKAIEAANRIEWLMDMLTKAKESGKFNKSTSDKFSKLVDYMIVSGIRG